MEPAGAKIESMLTIMPFAEPENFPMQDFLSIGFTLHRIVLSKVKTEGELDEESTCAKNAHIPLSRARSYDTRLYNLDMIISNEALAAITILTAESHPDEMDFIVKLIMNLLS